MQPGRTHEVPPPVFERLLWRVGYLLGHVLFAGADTPASVAHRLRLAYRLAGVRIEETEEIDGEHTTTFRCPYRHLLADRYGDRWVCHEKLDRVDDGYADYLGEKRGLRYQRPQACIGSERCFSVVAPDRGARPEP